MKKIAGIFIVIVSCFYSKNKANDMKTYTLKYGDVLKLQDIELTFLDIKQEKQKTRILLKGFFKNTEFTLVLEEKYPSYIGDYIVKIDKLNYSPEDKENSEVRIIYTGIKGERVEFEDFKKGYNSGFRERGDFVIKNKEDFKKLWDKMFSLLFPKPEIPELDFDKFMLIGSFMGSKPTGGYSVLIEKITEDEDKVRVFIREVYPGKKCIVTMAFTQPFHIVKLEKKNKEVEFYHQVIIRHCP